MSDEAKTNNKKKIFIIVAVIVVIAIVGVVGLLLGKKQETTGTEWGDTYSVYIKDISDNLEDMSSKEYEEFPTYRYGLPEGVDIDSVKAEFIDVDKDETPEMILFYTIGNAKESQISLITTEDEDVNFAWTIRSGEDVKLLYNIENNEYDYYLIHQTNSNGILYTNLRELKTSDNTEYIQFGEKEASAKFDETFIEVETDDISMAIKPNMENSEIKSEIKTAVENYNSFDNIVTDEVKTATEQKIEERKQKQEEERIATEEKAKKEAEEKAAAEEATKKAAEKEAEEKAAAESEKTSKSVKVGKYILKYGTYKGTGGSDSLYDGATFVLKPDHTYSLTMNGLHGKYTNTGTWQPATTELSLDGDQWSFKVLGDNYLGAIGGDSGKFKWASE